MNFIRIINAIFESIFKTNVEELSKDIADGFAQGIAEAVFGDMRISMIT